MAIFSSLEAADVMSAPHESEPRQQPPWLELKHGGLKMARLVYSSDYYVLEMTDFATVWRERLESADMRERQQKCHCPIKLQAASEILQFGEFLSKHLPDAGLESDGENYVLTVSHAADGKVIGFEFKLKPVDRTTASEILAELSLSLRAVIGNLYNRVEQLNEIVQEKNYHIRAMADAVSRSSVYVPRRYESAYDDAFKKKGDPVKLSLSEILHEHWPTQSLSTVEPGLSPAKPPENDSEGEKTRLKRRADLKASTVRLKKPRLF